MTNTISSATEVAATGIARPARMVMSLSEMRLLARDPLRYRRQILLKDYFSGRKCTVLMLDYRTGVPQYRGDSAPPPTENVGPR